MPAHKMKDGRWRVWLDLGSDPVSGQRLRKKVEARTKREAESKATEVRERHTRGEDVHAKARTVSELLDEWLNTSVHQGKTENTFGDHGQCCREGENPGCETQAGTQPHTR
jgi:hypothetical protein